MVTGLTIYSLGLTGHIKTHFPVMFRLYQVLQTHKEQPTEDEIAIASGKKLLDSSEASNYLLKLEKASANVLQMFSQQQQQAAVKFPNFVSCPVVSYAHWQDKKWDQNEFEKILSEWIIACDQPFEEVDRPEFRRLLEYTHTHPTPLHIPHRNAIRSRIMKMGEDTIEGVKRMISVFNPFCGTKNMPVANIRGRKLTARSASR